MFSDLTSKIFLLKLLQTHTFIPTSMRRGNSIIASHHVFTITFYAATLQHFSLLTKLKDFDFFKAITLSTLNIIYIKLFT